MRLLIADFFVRFVAFAGGMFLALAVTAQASGDTAITTTDSYLPNIPREQQFLFSSYEDVQTLFNENRYTPEAWQAGLRDIPRIYLTDVHERWRDRTSSEVSVLVKKRIFFRALAPLALHANELILADRARLQKLHSVYVAKPASLNAEDLQWLSELAASYGVLKADETLDAKHLAELERRVDIIPVSLALAQSAEESGWGTSRFAAAGNALFGQWTWGDQGIKPEAQRAALGNHKIARFDSLQQSVSAYMRNLNSHYAYQALRDKRAKLRAKRKLITGASLAKTLNKYSERGDAYVESLQAIMRVNHLAPTDKVFFQDMQPIYLVPVDAQAPVAENVAGGADPARMTLGMKTWIWEQTRYHDDTVMAPKKAGVFTLRFDELAKRVAVGTDCNSMQGSYQLDGNNMGFDKFIATRMYCEGAQELEFSKMLGAVRSYLFTAKGELILELEHHGGSAIFR